MLIDPSVIKHSNNRYGSKKMHTVEVGLLSMHFSRDRLIAISHPGAGFIVLQCDDSVILANHIHEFKYHPEINHYKYYKPVYSDHELQRLAWKYLTIETSGNRELGKRTSNQ